MAHRVMKDQARSLVDLVFQVLRIWGRLHVARAMAPVHPMASVSVMALLIWIRILFFQRGWLDFS